MACLSWSSLQKAHPVARRILIACLPHALLCIAHFTYLIVGTLLLQAIEGHGSTQLENYLEDVAHMRRTLEDAMWNATHGVQMGGADTNWTKLLDQYTEFVSRPEWKLGRLQAVTNGVAWSFSSTMLFCLITISTIGYGDIVPVTSGGRIFVGVYATFGIPLNVIFLADIGFLLAKLIVSVIHTCRIMWHVNGMSTKPNNMLTKRNIARPPVKGMRGRFTRNNKRSRPKSSAEMSAQNARRGLRRGGGMSAISMMSIHGPKSVVNRESASSDTKPGSVYPQEAPQRCSKKERYDVSGSVVDNGSESIALQEVPRENGSGITQGISQSHLVNCAVPPDTIVTVSKRNDHNSDIGHMTDKTDSSTVIISKADEVNDNKMDLDDKDEDVDDEDVDMEVPLFVVLIIVILYVTIGSCFMVIIENWSYSEALWFTFITLTTIGYGDIAPNNHYQDQYFFTYIVYIVLGLSVVSTCIALAQGKVLRAIDRFTTRIKSYA